MQLFNQCHMPGPFRYILLLYMPYVIVEASPQVCMKNTAREECQVVNTAQAESCIYHETPQTAVFSYRQS